MPNPVTNNLYDYKKEYPLDKVVFEVKYGRTKYQILEPSEEVLTQWCAEVDKIYENLQSGEFNLTNILRVRAEEIQAALDNDKLIDEDLRLFAISLFVLAHRAAVGGNIAAFKKVLSGGAYMMDSFLDSDEFVCCIDPVSVVWRIAAEYGIDGDIAGKIHRYFRSKSGIIVDPMVYLRGGYFENSNEHIVSFGKAFIFGIICRLHRRLKLAFRDNLT
ncbi:hypothetical protein GF354_02295 [Candidatus Peregrinibacteria bacterium]|nr:hypothetical protein [Candidatus Peregrinibacteria bacterium]